MLQQNVFFRVVAPTVLVSLILLASCTVVSVYLYRQQWVTAQEYREDVDSRAVAHSLEVTLRDLASLLDSAVSQPQRIRAEADEYEARIREMLDRATELADKQFERQSVDEITTHYERYLTALHKAFADPQASGQFALARQILRDEMLPRAVALRKFNAAQIEASQDRHLGKLERMIGGLAAVGGIGSIAGLVLGYGVARGLRRSLYRLSVQVRDAAGKLRQDLPEVTLEEQGDLHGLDQQMKEVVHQVEQVVDRLQQREHEVLRAEQLAAVGQVAAGVAHELRNPLTSIKMLVQKNRRDQSSEGLPAQNLQIIEQEIRRMERCLQTFLDFARPPKPSRRQTELAGVVERAFALVRGRAGKQQVRLEFTPPPQGVIAELDADQIHQLLVNLTLNALDAMPTGGSLHVELDPHDDRVELRVHDTGPGTSPQILPRLFEPFVSSKETGIGLGLVVSRRIAEEHGGSLTAHNLPEGGACFVLRLPTH